MGGGRRIRQHEEMPENRIIPFYAKALSGVHFQFKDQICVSTYEVQTQTDGGDEQALIVYKYKSELKGKKLEDSKNRE